MQINVSTYIAGKSSVHRLDARVKVVLLAAYCVAVFFVSTWVGMLLASAMFAAVLAISCIAPQRVLGLVKPVYVLVALTVLLNSFTFATPDALALAQAQAGEQGAMGNVLLPIVGNLCFTGAGFTRGCFFGIRILLLAYACILVSFTTTSTELMGAVNWFLAPLRKAGVSTDDAAMICSIAIRFIPLIADEFCQIRNAQWARGGKFDEGSLAQRLKAWVSVLVPLVAGMFRRADALALAMDARCYGAADERTSLEHSHAGATAGAALLTGLLACGLLAWLF